MSKKSSTWLILLAALNLRLAVTAIAPLFSLIQQTWQVSAAYTGLLVTLPLICFAGGALFAPRLIAKHSSQSLLQLAGLLIIGGSLLRPLNSTTLIGGTLLIGLAIALLNVLIPTLIAQTNRITQLTSYYSVTMNAVAALGTALIIPVATWLGWQWAIIGLGIPAIGLLPKLKKSAVNKPVRFHQTAALNWRGLLHNHSTLLLALFMGLQSLTFYSLTTWLPSIFKAFGASNAEAGLLLAVFQIVGIPAALVLNHVQIRRPLLIGLLIGYLAGMGLLSLAPVGHWFSATILGFTASLIFSVALTLIGTSSQKPALIAQRSAFAQAVGYSLAAVGPLCFGQLQTWTGNWSLGIMILVGLMLTTVLVGWRLVK